MSYSGTELSTFRQVGIPILSILLIRETWQELIRGPIPIKQDLKSVFTRRVDVDIDLTGCIVLYAEVGYHCV